MKRVYIAPKINVYECFSEEGIMQYTSPGVDDNTNGGASGPGNGDGEEAAGSKFHSDSFWDED